MIALIFVLLVTSAQTLPAREERQVYRHDDSAPHISYSRVIPEGKASDDETGGSLIYVNPNIQLRTPGSSDKPYVALSDFSSDQGAGTVLSSPVAIEGREWHPIAILPGVVTLKSRWNSVPDYAISPSQDSVEVEASQIKHDQAIANAYSRVWTKAGAGAAQTQATGILPFVVRGSDQVQNDAVRAQQRHLVTASDESNGKVTGILLVRQENPAPVKIVQYTTPAVPSPAPQQEIKLLKYVAVPVANAPATVTEIATAPLLTRLEIPTSPIVTKVDETSPILTKISALPAQYLATLRANPTYTYAASAPIITKVSLQPSVSKLVSQVPYIHPVPSQSQILSQYHAQDELGQYSYGYAGGSSAKSETKTLDGVTRGSYSYLDPNGIVQSRSYVADDVHGFRVVASDLPQPTSTIVADSPVAY